MSADPQDRRKFLSRCTVGLLSLIGALVAAPVVAYVVAPLRRRPGVPKPGEMVDIGPLAELPLGKWLLLPVDVVLQDGWEQVRERHSVYVRRTGDKPDQVSVLSPLCPHLGCPVGWVQEDGKFRCPCHGGVFKDDGAHLSGPPPRSLDPLQFEIRSGRLWVRWEDFKIGVANRVPVQV
jgi:menaquinol-cytochrome c reductase iron-sulfur subunit